MALKLLLLTEISWFCFAKGFLPESSCFLWPLREYSEFRVQCLREGRVPQKMDQEPEFPQVQALREWGIERHTENLHVQERFPS